MFFASDVLPHQVHNMPGALRYCDEGRVPCDGGGWGGGDLLLSFVQGLGQHLGLDGKVCHLQVASWDSIKAVNDHDGRLQMV